VKAAKGSLKVLDYSGKTVATLQPALTPGLHVANWNLVTVAVRRPARAGSPARPSFRTAAAGMYRVVLNLDGVEVAQGLRVEEDPTLPTNLIAQDEETAQPAPKKKPQPARIDD
jgi:hypothetical protein